MDTVIRVKEAMTNRVITLGPDQTVDKAAQVMKKKGIGCVIVVENNKPIGIVTERDMCYGVVAPNKLPNTIKVKEIMTSKIRTISPKETLIETAKIMVKNNFRRLPVIENKRLIGIITSRDIVALSPKTIEVLREFNDIYGAKEYTPKNEVMEEGVCEVCGGFAATLINIDGK